MFNWSEVYLYRSNFLQNPYFSYLVDFVHTCALCSMDLYRKWDVKNCFAFVLQFFSLISDGLGSVLLFCVQNFQRSPIPQTRNC